MDDTKNLKSLDITLGLLSFGVGVVDGVCGSYGLVSTQMQYLLAAAPPVVQGAINAAIGSIDALADGFRHRKGQEKIEISFVRNGLYSYSYHAPVSTKNNPLTIMDKMQIVLGASAVGGGIGCTYGASAGVAQTGSGILLGYSIGQWIRHMGGK